jgi:hypothetical protein
MRAMRQDSDVEGRWSPWPIWLWMRLQRLKRVTGGRIVTVCGLDQTGRSYLTEVLVFYDRGELRALNPIYWSGTSIATTPTTAAAQQRQACPGR